MDSLRWHTIRANRVFLQSIKDKIWNFNFKFESHRYDILSDLRSLERKWFLDINNKFNLDKYENLDFDTKQFYKEFINCIEKHLYLPEYRELRIKILLDDEFKYDRKSFEKIFL